MGGQCAAGNGAAWPTPLCRPIPSHRGRPTPLPLLPSGDVPPSGAVKPPLKPFNLSRKILETFGQSYLISCCICSHLGRLGYPPPHPSPSQILLGMKSAKKAGFPLIPSLAKALCNTICTPLCCLSFPLTISSTALGVGQQQGAVSTALRRLQVDVPKGHDEGGARGGPQLPMAHRVVGVRAGVVPGAQRPTLCCQHCVAAAVPYMKAKEWGCSPCLSFPMLHCPIGIWVLFQSLLGMTPPPTVTAASISPLQTSLCHPFAFRTPMWGK